MSKPFIQFELDAAKKAPTLASALRISLSTAMGGLTRMWLHVYEGKTDTVTAFYLRSFFEVDHAIAGEALVELGFAVAINPTTWQVKGAGRYKRLSEVRSEAGRKGAAKTNGRSAIAAANDHDGSAIVDHDDEGDRQNPANVAHGSASGRQVPRQASGKTPKEPTSAAANERQNPEKGRQKAALEPIGSLSKREREPYARMDAGEAPSQPAPRGARSEGAGRHRANGVRYANDEPEPGTPEWDAAVARSKAEGWG